MDEIVPIFDAINLNSRINPEFFENRGVEPSNDYYRFHINLINHSGLYWITQIVTNLNFKNAEPVSVVEIFTDSEKHLAKKLLNIVKGIPEINDWHFLWFSDGKKMKRSQYTELRNLWEQNLQTSN